jgi:ribosomal-protein-serine acetyltransferase
VPLLPPSIAADGLELRRWRTTHVDDALRAVELSLPALRLCMPWAQGPPSASGLAEVIRTGEQDFDGDREWNYFVFEAVTGELVGAIGIGEHHDPDGPEIGYWIRSDRTGRGYATVATAALINVAFKDLADIQQLRIRMDTANQPSAAVPPKLGFRFYKTESRPIAAQGHTGHGFVWILDRPS